MDLINYYEETKCKIYPGSVAKTRSGSIVVLSTAQFDQVIGALCQVGNSSCCEKCRTNRNYKVIEELSDHIETVLLVWD